ncbi:MAG TPA: DUF5666 domain-containing protein [Blastocatellia bacterium]|nr:DUF5666 domain-containing protein [Blastocatellia bacterium]
MKRRTLRIVTLIAMICGLFSAGEALAGHENEVKFTATVESMPGNGFTGDWRIGGRTVHVTNSTEIDQEDGAIVTGSTVKVEGRQRTDGSVDATEIERRGGNSGGGSGSGSGGSGGGSGSGGNGGGNNNADDVTFKGTIESFPGGFVGDWRIGGRTIHVTASTRIEQELGPVAVGAFSEVKGTQRADGSMDATKIEIKSNVAGGDGRDELKGTIQSLPNTLNFIGDWTVSGRAVHVSAATTIDREHGPIAVGAFVEVNGVRRADGSIDATRIEVKTDVDSSDGDNKNVKGTIESLPNTAGLMGDWVINGRIVHVISSTKLKTEHGAFAIGVRVKVKGIQLADGTVVAIKIQVRDSN